MRVILSLVVMVVLTGCGHNTAMLMIGKKGTIGIDPQSMSMNAQYMDGFALGDVSRENSEWEIEIDDAAGISYDSKEGSLKGVKKLKRKLGPQITGYLVDLAEKSPEAAKAYMEATKAYWESKTTK